MLDGVEQTAKEAIEIINGINRLMRVTSIKYKQSYLEFIVKI